MIQTSCDQEFSQDRFAAYLPRRAGATRNPPDSAGWVLGSGRSGTPAGCDAKRGSDQLFGWSEPHLFILLGVGREGPGSGSRDKGSDLRLGAIAVQRHAGHRWDEAIPVGQRVPTGFHRRTSRALSNKFDLNGQYAELFLLRAIVRRMSVSCCSGVLSGLIREASSVSSICSNEV